MKYPWEEDATWWELVFIWLLRWGGTIFFALVFSYLLVLIYIWMRS